MSSRLLLAALALLGAAACSRPTAPGHPPRHVLLVTAEGLRADHLSAYQYARPTSAWTVDGGQRELGRAVAIDDLAADGVLFANAFSSAESTLTALKTIHVGAPPAFGEVVTGLSADAHTLAERFREAGYVTAAFVSGDRLGAAGGFDQGFDEFRHRAADDQSLPMAVRWLFEHDLGDGRPLFLWIHLSGTAAPYAPGATPPIPGEQADTLDYVRLHFEQARAQDPDADLAPVIDDEPLEATAWNFGEMFLDPGYAGAANGTREFLASAGELDFADRRRVIDLYDGDVAELASRLRSFLLAYQSAGEINAAWDDTLVVVCAANGVELGERGRWGESLYAGGLHVPLLFRHPDSILGRRITDEVAELSDIGPTLFDWTGAVPVERGSGRAGRSLAPLLDASTEALPRERPAVSIADAGRQAASLRTQRWTLVWRNQGGVESSELYDRVHDPMELSDVAADRPALAKQLRDQLVWLLTEAGA